MVEVGGQVDMAGGGVKLKENTDSVVVDSV